MVRPSEDTEDDKTSTLTPIQVPVKLWKGWTYQQLEAEYELVWQHAGLLNPSTHNTLFRLEIRMLEEQGIPAVKADVLH